MGLIREPLNIDFYVDPRPLTKVEETKISEYIKAYKQRRKDLKAKEKVHTSNTR